MRVGRAELVFSSNSAGPTPFDDLTELEHHTAKAASNPQDWMPWNCRQALDDTAPAFATH
jgi:hypothetical protein